MTVVLLVVLISISACESKRRQPVLEASLAASRERVINWIQANGCQAMIAYRRNDQDEFDEVARIGPGTTDLTRYIDANSFELFRGEGDVDGVIAILSHPQENCGGSVVVEFRSVIAGKVTLISDREELVVEDSLLLEVGGSLWSGMDCERPNPYRKWGQ